MWPWKKRKHDQPQAAGPPSSRKAPGAADSGDAGIRVSGWTEREEKPRWQAFPASTQAGEPFRVAFSRQAYADLVGHGKENLDGEVCGVLAGLLCEDEQGKYVSVQAAVAGSATQHGAAHVTYTQETWNRIHEKMERQYPDLRIVGWYHSHPGFGVELSDMDKFIQSNFFGSPGQVAFVVDPLGGDEGLYAQVGGALVPLQRFWVEGRERTCCAGPGAARGGEATGAAGAEDMARALRAIEERLAQTVQAVEDLRNTYYKFLLAVGMAVALGVAFWIGFTIYSHLLGARNPPETQAFLPIPAKIPGISGEVPGTPVKIQGEWRWVGAIPVLQKLPPEMEAQLNELERLQFEAAAIERLKMEAEKGLAEPAQPSAKEKPQGAAKRTGGGSP